MTITTPASPRLTAPSAFILPKAASQPLQSALENTNHLYKYMAPALHAIVYTTSAGLSRTAAFAFPTTPSVDGLSYDFRHLIRTGSGTANLTVKVEAHDGSSWSTLENNTAITSTADSVITYNHTETVASNIRQFRISYGRAASGAYYPESVLISPNTSGSVGAGATDAGFYPFDDGILAGAGGPITTEHVERCRANSIAILRDRKQCVLSFVQEGPTGSAMLDIADGAHPAGYWNLIGVAAATFPFQKNPTITIKAIASVDAGATAALLRVGQLGGNTIELAADGSIVSADLALKTPGGAVSTAEIGIWAKRTAGNSCFVHAVCGFWTPGE